MCFECELISPNASMECRSVSKQTKYLKNYYPHISVTSSNPPHPKYYISNPTRNDRCFTLLQEPFKASRNYFDYFLNVISKPAKIKEIGPNTPEITVCLIFHELPLFLEEFLGSFYGVHDRRLLAFFALKF